MNHKIFLFSRLFSTHGLGKKLLEENFFTFFFPKTLKKPCGYYEDMSQDTFGNIHRCGTCIWIRAQEQYAGHGRQGHFFASPPGGLYVTALYKTKHKCYPGVFLTPAMTWTAKNILDSRLEKSFYLWTPSFFSLRWKNDLYGGWRKIGGAMVEIYEDSQGDTWWIMSFGLNINSVFSRGKSQWCSIYDLTGQTLDISGFFLDYCESLEKILPLFDKPSSRENLYGLKADCDVQEKDMKEGVNKSFREYGEDVFLQTISSWHYGTFWGLNNEGQVLLEEKKNIKNPYDALVLFPALCQNKNMPL